MKQSQTHWRNVRWLQTWVRQHPSKDQAKPAKRGLRGDSLRRVTEHWVSADVIAEHLGVTKDSIYIFIANRQMPAHRVGRLWKFQITEVDAWVRGDGATDAAGEKLD